MADGGTEAFRYIEPPTYHNNVTLTGIKELEQTISFNRFTTLSSTSTDVGGGYPTNHDNNSHDVLETTLAADRKDERAEAAVHDENLENREKWDNQLDFILSCLGYAVGLGNVWRFPYLCGRNGGAAFLIPYGIMLVFAGLPTFYLELGIGQFASLSPHLLYRRMSPIFTGIGYTMISISVFTGIYYNMIIAWSLYYFVVSFQGLWKDLPWLKCDNDFNTPACFDDRTSKTCTDTEIYYLGVCRKIADLTQDDRLALDGLNFTGNGIRRSPAADYNDYVLGITPEMQTMGLSAGVGWPQWGLLLALAVSWVMIFCMLIKGVKSSGKVVYFTATFPYVILVILLIRGLTLDGALDGLAFYLIPRPAKLLESGVWRDAAIQIFFSLSLGGGGLTTLASYNKFHNNLYRDTLIVVFGNCATSIFAGFVIFPVIGFVAKELYPTLNAYDRVAKMAASGPSLAFIAYPEAIKRLPWPVVWALLFFFMLIILGIDSQLVIVEVVTTAICDQWPSMRGFKRKAMVVGSVCFGCFLLGIILTTPGGPYILNLLDTFAGGWTLVIACLCEIVMVAWVYGYKRFIGDIQLMLGAPPNAFYRVLGYPVNPYFWVNWIAITPILLTAILLFTFADYEPLKYGDWVYPAWIENIGWLIAIGCIMWIPIVAIYHCLTLAIPDWSPITQPTSAWGAGDLQVRQKQRAVEMQMSGVSASKSNPAGAYSNQAFNQPATAPVYPITQQQPYPAYRGSYS